MWNECGDKMKNPKLRAEVMILNEDRSKVLVQCDLSETFYHFQVVLLNLVKQQKKQ